MDSSVDHEEVVDDNNNSDGAVVYLTCVSSVQRSLNMHNSVQSGNGIIHIQKKMGDFIEPIAYRGTNFKVRIKTL